MLQVNGDFLFNWIRTPRKRPSTAIIACLVALIEVSMTTLPAKADPPKEAEELAMEADLRVLELAFKGYVAIVFPVGPENRCLVEPTEIQRRSRDTYRGWYQVTVDARCENQPVETYKVWFLCVKRNVLTCSLIRAPKDQSEMTPDESR